ncbi:MAG: glutamine synthetase [Candidatus Thermoplasmatota archaeon]|nr:glutamine synthetase [Candidatus Thermoplasmatota archaeon]
MSTNVEIPEDIDSIALKFLDLRGKAREIRVPPEMWDVVKEDGVSFDSSNVGFTAVSESDMIAVPEPSSMKVLDYGNEKVAVFLCEMEWPDGEAFEGDPRYMLRKTIEELSERGIEIHVKPEYEFHLLDDETLEPRDTGYYIDGRTGYTGMVGQLAKTMQKYDFEVEKIHHEAGPGQYEIEPLPYEDPIEAADEFIFIKEIVKKKARENGAHATFMPKPVPKEAGNGLHIHMSLFQDSEYMFSPDEVNEKAAGFVGGLLEHARALSGIVSPTINSYKRLVPGYEAPVYISWGGENRSVLVRIPAYGSSEEEKGRVEYRAGDASANIYLMLNSLIQAGMDGMERPLDPGEGTKENLFEKSEQEIKNMGIEFLPVNLSEAMKELEKDEVIRGSLGESYKYYKKLKKQEILEFSRDITDWELENYIDY